MQFSTTLEFSNAGRPAVPKFSLQNDHRVQQILKDLDRIRNTKKRKQLKKCEHLVYQITQLLRKSKEDHLLHTTAVWVLVVLFRMFPVEVKAVMLQAGVPGILHQILQLNLLSGSSRQYASELVFFLTTNHVYEPNDSVKGGGPMTKFPEIQAYNRYQADIDDISILSDMSNTDNNPKPLRQPFIPYRIDESNMMKMDSLFERGYEAQLAASLPNVRLLSRYGASHEKGESDDDDSMYNPFDIYKGKDDNDDLSDDDDASDSSEGIEEHSERAESESTNSVAGSTSAASKKQLDITHKYSNPLLAEKNKKMQAYRKNSFLMHQFTDNVSVSSTSTHRQLQNDGGLWQQQFGDRPRTSAAIMQQQSTLPAIPASSPFRLGKLQENIHQTNLNNNNNLLDDDDHSLALSNSSKSSSRAGKSVFSTQSLDRFPVLASSAPQKRRDSRASSSKINLQTRLSSAPAAASFMSPNTITGGLRKRNRSMGEEADNRSTSSFQGFFGPPPRSTAQTPIDIYSRKKFSASILSASIPQNNLSIMSAEQFMSELDPLSGLNTSSAGSDVPNKFTSSKKYPNRFKVNIHINTKDMDMTSEMDETEQRRSKSAKISGGSPLKIGTKGFEEDGEEEEEDEDAWDSSDEEMNNYYTKLVESEIEEEESNPFLKIKRMRIRAEKLIDHRFIHALFVKKMTVQDTQDLIRRMEDIIYLLDPQETGYITFEQFTKIIMAVAPKHLLKRNIQEFFEFQTDSMQHLIDYQEFLISGKVLVLTKLQRQQYDRFKKKAKNYMLSDTEREALKDTQEVFAYRNENSTYTKAWLSRQKQYTGETSTYTWKNHMKWYQKRKSQVLIWLIRRARRALEYEVELLKAFEALKKLRWKAFAQTDLMALGRDALLAQAQREESKIRLVKRVYHARNYMKKVKDAHEYLKYMGLGAIKDMEYYERHYGEASRHSAASGEAANNTTQLSAQDRILAAQQKAMRETLAKIQQQKLQAILQKKVNYSNLYKVAELQKLSQKALCVRAQLALAHSAKQDVAFQYLYEHAQHVLQQQFKKEKVRRELVLIADRALQFCLDKDQVQLSLLRIGRQKYNWICNQIDALQWLIRKGQTTVDFLNKKQARGFGLIEIARRTLNFMNTREFSFEYLSHRCQKSVQFIAKKQEAMEFLRRKPYRLWDVFDHQIEVQATLAQTGKRALAHMRRKRKAANFLQYIASKGLAQHRKSQTTFHELCQIGMRARYEVFRTSILKKENLKLYQYFMREKQIVLKNDVKVMQGYQEYYQKKMLAKGIVVSPNTSPSRFLSFRTTNNNPTSPTAKRRAEARAAALATVGSPDNTNNNLLEGVTEEEEDFDRDYSAKLMTIDTLSAKLNGIQVAPTKKLRESRTGSLDGFAGSGKFSRMNSSNITSPMKRTLSSQFLLPSETEDQGLSTRLSSAPVNDSLLLPPLLEDANGDEKNEEKSLSKETEEQKSPDRTFELTSIQQPDPTTIINPDNDRREIVNQSTSRPMSPAIQLTSESRPSSRPLTSTNPLRPSTSNSSRPISSSSPLRVRTPLLQNASSMFDLTTRSRPLTGMTSSSQLDYLPGAIEDDPFTILIQNIVKMEIIECFQLISSIFTPTFVLVKNKLQKLQLLLPEIPPTEGEGKGGTGTTTPALSRAPSMLKKGAKNPYGGSRTLSAAPSTKNMIAPSTTATTSGEPSGEKKTASQLEDEEGRKAAISDNAQYDIIGKYGFLKLLNNGKYLQLSEFAVTEAFRNLDTNTSNYVSVTNVYYYLWKQLLTKHKLVKYLVAENRLALAAEGSRPGTSNSTRDLLNYDAMSRPGTAPSSSMFLSSNNFKTTASSTNFLSRRLLTAGESPEKVNNSTTSMKKRKTIPNNRIIMNEILTAEERAIMLIYKRMLRDDAFYKSLLETDKNKKLSAFEEYKLKMQKLAEEKAALLAEEDDYYDDDYNYGDEEEDEDILFADLEKLKKMDVGRLMKYLTKKREKAKEENKMREETGDNSRNSPNPPLDEANQIATSSNQEAPIVENGSTDNKTISRPMSSSLVKSKLEAMIKEDAAINKEG